MLWGQIFLWDSGGAISGGHLIIPVDWDQAWMQNYFFFSYTTQDVYF